MFDKTAGFWLNHLSIVRTSKLRVKYNGSNRSACHGSQSRFSIILPNPGRLMFSFVFGWKEMLTFWDEDNFQCDRSYLQLI